MKVGKVGSILFFFFLFTCLIFLIFTLSVIKLWDRLQLSYVVSRLVNIIEFSSLMYHVDNKFVKSALKQSSSLVI